MRGRSKGLKAPSDAPDRILASARKLMAQQGFEATSTKAIAQDAGVPSGLVFYYFKTKDDLLEAIFRSNPPLQVISAMKEAFAGAQRDPLETALHAALCEATRKHRSEMYILLSVIGSSRPIAKRLRQMRKDAVATLAEFFRVQFPSAGFCVDPTILAQVVSSAILIAAMLDQPRDVDAYAAGLASLVRAGMQC